MLDYPRTTPSFRRSCAVLTVLCGTLALAGSAARAGARENTFTVSGKYHGTLTLTNPAADCSENTVTETVTGSWSCPSVHHL
jgi:hypothetical protein